MVSHSYGLMLPSSLGQFFKPIGTANDAKFAEFAAEIHSGDGFRTDDERCKMLAAILDMSISDVSALLGVLGGVYARFRSLENKDALFEDLFSSFLSDGMNIMSTDDGGYGEQQKFVDRLKQLFARNDALDQAEKYARLARGVLDQITDVSAFVDLRANFTSSRDRILGFVPIVQIQILTDSDDATKQLQVFQINAGTLDKLETMIKDIRARRELLANHPAIGKTVHMEEFK